jgi:5-methylcytosine-specific restriction endonuclease McrA
MRIGAEMPYKDPEKKRANCIAYRATHKEEKAVYNAIYRSAHLEEERVRNAAYRASHKEHISERNRAYSESHREGLAEYAAAWRAARPEYTASYCATHRKERSAYYVAHKEQIAAYAAMYCQNHLPENAAKSAARRALLLGATLGNLAEIKAIYKQAKESPKVRCYICGDWIPMGKRHVDHVVPLSKGGKHRPSNLAVSCADCNLRKNDKLPSEVGVLL